MRIVIGWPYGPHMTSTAHRFAECPDCGHHLRVCPMDDGSAAFWCHTDGHDPLAAVDVYLEHDERAVVKVDDDGHPCLFVVTLPKCSECGDVLDIPADVHASHGMCGSCVHDALRSGWEPPADITACEICTRNVDEGDEPGTIHLDGRDIDVCSEFCTELAAQLATV